MIRRLVRLTVVFATLLAARVVAAQAAFVPESMLAVGTDRATVVAFIHADDPGVAAWELEGVEDLGPVGGAVTAPAESIAFSDCRRIGTGDWRCLVALTKVKGGALFERNAKLIFTDPKGAADAAKKLQVARYKLVTKLPFLSWSVTAAQDSLVSPPNDELEITVSSVDGDASGVHIESTSLREASTGVRVNPGWLELCANKLPVACAAPGVLAAGVRVPLYIRFNGDIPAGAYAGAINLAIRESPESKGVQVASLGRSSGRARWLGVGAIALGLLLSLVGGVFARNLAATSRAMLPAARLVEVAQRLLGSVKEPGAPAPQTQAAIDSVIAELSLSTLRSEGFVPSVLATPFGDAANDPQKYAGYLQQRSDRLGALGFLLEQGLVPARAAHYDASNPAAVTARSKALGALDALAASPPKSVEDLAKLIPPILAVYENDKKPPAPAAAAAAFGPGRVTPIAERPTFESLSFRIDSASAAGWFVSIVASLVGGYALLIAPNQGFGVNMDFVKCFLWGVGIQFAGQQLGQLSPSSISASLGFKAPT